MADDAVGNRAITREVGEESFLELRWKWIVDIGSERLLPEAPENLRRVERRGEERRKETELPLNLRLDLFVRSREPSLFVTWRPRE